MKLDAKLVKLMATAIADVVVDGNNDGVSKVVKKPDPK